MTADGYVSCEDCKEVYDGNPPCETCDMPKLTFEGQQAWAIWCVLNQFARPPSWTGVSRIPLDQVIEACILYDGTFETFERILLLEKTIVDRWEEKMQAERKAKEAQNGLINRDKHRRR